MNASEMAEKARNLSEQATQRAQDWGETGRRKAREAADATQQYVQENTWTSIGIAAGVGFALGFLLARMRD